MLQRLSLPALLLCFLLSALQACANEETHLGRAIRESGRASIHASVAAGHALAASGQATLAVSSVPLALSGSALTTLGNVSTSSAIEMEKAASAPVGAPLELSDEYLITIPPDQALNP